jgi:protein SCO1/2
MIDTQPLTRATSEEDVAALVDAVKRAPDRRPVLVDLLPERIDLYVGRSANAIVRMRGYILAAFEQIGLPRPALPYVLEELQNGRDAYLVAAAARAVRGLDHASPELGAYLLRAVANIRYADDAVSFDSYKPNWPAPGYTTALIEIFATFAWLGVHARPALADLEVLRAAPAGFSAQVNAALAGALEAIRASPMPAQKCSAEHDCCCAGPEVVDLSTAPMSRPPGAGAVPTDVELEDQDGRSLKYAEFFSQTPAIVVFFYTRCDNPNKCSLSITKLSHLQRAVEAAGLGGQVRLAAITYDPAYDLPIRLKAYGLNRGVEFGEGVRFFRAPSNFASVREYFQLGVNYGDVLVNRHAIELFILDASGGIVDAQTRLQWDPADVLERATSLLA